MECLLKSYVYITGYSCVLEESFQIRLFFSFSFWNMVSMKDAPRIGEEYAIHISLTCVVAILEREVLPARNLKFNKKGHQSHQSHKGPPFLSKMKICSGGSSILVSQFLFMLFQSPEYCQSFEYFFVSVSYSDE